MTFAAGDSVLVARDGLVYGNRWRDARPVAVPGDISRWMDHLERVVPVEAERKHILDVMAFKLQYPQIKVNHAVFHGGTSGAGKDTAWHPFLWAIGKSNVKEVKSDAVTGQWGYALECEVLVLQELRDSEAKDRRALENTLKNIIAAPPEYLTVNRKGLHPYEAPNRLFVLATSNERAAISLPTGDRRWFVIWTDAPRMSDAEGRAMWNWMNAGGASAVAAWLYKRDVSAFNPGAAPPMTEAKQILIEAGMSNAEAYLVQLMNERRSEFARGVVCGPWHGLCDRLAGAAPSGVKLHVNALLHAFREAGWIDKGRVNSREFPSNKHLFCRPDRADLPKSELRRIAESPDGVVSIVK